MAKTGNQDWHAQWQGRCVGFIPRTIFHKDESGNLRPPRDVIFFQDWEAPDPEAWRSIKELQAKPIMTPAEEYDRRNVVGRYNWIRWAVGQPHYPGYGYLPDPDAELLAFIATLGPEYQGVGTTGKMEAQVVLEWEKQDEVKKAVPEVVQPIQKETVVWGLVVPKPEEPPKPAEDLSWIG